MRNFWFVGCTRLWRSTVAHTAAEQTNFSVTFGNLLWLRTVSLLLHTHLWWCRNLQKQISFTIKYYPVNIYAWSFCTTIFTSEVTLSLTKRQFVYIGRVRTWIGTLRQNAVHFNTSFWRKTKTKQKHFWWWSRGIYLAECLVIFEVCLIVLRRH